MLQKIPTGLFSRASATGRIAMQFSLAGTRKLLGSRQEADVQLGGVLLSELDQLKGMAMKVGQILSYMDVGLSEEVTAKLACLRHGVQALPAEEIDALLEAAFGRPVEDIFLEFDGRAIAAASIGQVHRARLFGGEEVAVKVQYPDVMKSMRADFVQLGRLGGLAGLFSNVDGRAIVEELKARVLEECDYEREADWQRRFGALFVSDASIEVPEVYGALSRSNVLTTRFCEGARFEEFVEDASPEAREKAAQALIRLAFVPLFTEGVLHADPHPGNQIYRPDGRIVALDFGCVRVFEPEFLEVYRQFYGAVFEENRAHFRSCAVALGLAPDPDRIDFDELWAMYRWLYAPLYCRQFSFERSWWLRGRRFTSPSAKNARHQGFPPEWLWLQRVHWGLWAVLVKLEASGDFATPFRAWMSLGA